MSKGDGRRDPQVPEEQVKQQWDKTLGKAKREPGKWVLRDGELVRVPK